MQLNHLPFLLAASSDAMFQFIVGMGVVFPALVMARKRSPYLVDYFLIVVAFNRELRRLIDWALGQYDSTPFLSITPMIIVCFMIAAALMRWRYLPFHVRRAFLWIAVGLAYSLAIGAKYQLAAIYGLMDYLMPLGVLLYCVSQFPSQRTIARWICVLGTLGVIVAAYGIVQWAIVPPWDAQWIMSSGMWSSMGMPVPFKIGIASTLESRGPAAWFMASAAALMLASKEFRRPWGWLGLILVSGTLILTTVRSSWGFLTVSAVIFCILQRSRGIRALCLLALTYGVVYVAMPYLPQSEDFANRFSTLSVLDQDSSFQGRVGIAHDGIAGVLSKPLGYGMGSSGNGGRLVEGGTDGIGDNGYLSLLADLGLPGFACAAVGVFILLKQVVDRRINHGNAAADMGLAMFGSSLAFLFIANNLVGAHASYLWIAISGGIAGVTPDYVRSRLDGLHPTSPVLGSVIGRRGLHVRLPAMRQAGTPQARLRGPAQI